MLWIVKKQFITIIEKSDQNQNKHPIMGRLTSHASFKTTTNGYVCISMSLQEKVDIFSRVKLWFSIIPNPILYLSLSTINKIYS
jgi:hypothetical protein